MQAPANRTQPAAPTETRIFTVYQDDANDEIRFRAQFGWRLTSTAARSYTSDMVYTGASFGNSVSAQGGQISGRTHHKTDLVMTRVLDARGRRLQQLENDYELAAPMEVGKGGIFVIVGLVAVFIAPIPGVIAQWIVENTVNGTVGQLVGTTLILAGIGLTALWGVKLFRRDSQKRRQNAQNRERRAATLAEARRISGLRG